MRRPSFYIFLVLLLLFSPSRVAAQESTPPSQTFVIIHTPVPGQALQGTILITASINLDDYTSAELSFTYADDPRETWFVIQEFDEPGAAELSIEWDTTSLTDGEYNLRLAVITSEDKLSGFVPGIRVRNYTTVETSTPVPIPSPAPADTQMPSPTGTWTITPISFTPTPFPPNPAQLDIPEIGISIARGAAFAIGGLALFGLYAYLRNRRRR